MALSISGSSENLAVICPWCGWWLSCVVIFGENGVICAGCELPFTLKITMHKNYERLSSEQKKFLDEGKLRQIKP